MLMKFLQKIKTCCTKPSHEKMKTSFYGQVVEIDSAKLQNSYQLVLKPSPRNQGNQISMC